jgi:hypothetical protein
MTRSDRRYPETRIVWPLRSELCAADSRRGDARRPAPPPSRDRARFATSAEPDAAADALRGRTVVVLTGAGTAPIPGYRTIAVMEPRKPLTSRQPQRCGRTANAVLGGKSSGMETLLTAPFPTTAPHPRRAGDQGRRQRHHHSGTWTAAPEGRVATGRRRRHHGPRARLTCARPSPAQMSRSALILRERMARCS